MNNGNNVLIKEIPELLIAVNSLFSPKFPKVIIEDRRTANGSASGVILTEK